MLCEFLSIQPVAALLYLKLSGSGFRGCNIPTLLMFQHEARIGLFHPLGVTALRALWMRNPLRMHLLGLFNREP